MLNDEIIIKNYSKKISQGKKKYNNNDKKRIRFDRKKLKNNEIAKKKKQL